MSNPTPITDHADRMVELFLTQFADRQEMQAFAKHVLGPQVQAIEDVAQKLLLWLDPDNAEGVMLDKLGWIVGQPREGLIDDAYRLKIRARQARNRSRGRRSDLRLVAKLIVGQVYLGATFWPSWPAGYGMAIAVTSLMGDEQKAVVADFIRGATSGGVGLAGLAQYTGPVFGFDDDPDPLVAGVDEGFLADFF